MPPLIVVLDANILIPAGLRDLILRPAEQGLFEIRWSAEILAEVERHLPEFIAVDGNDERGIRRIKREKAARIIAAIRRAFPDMGVTNYQQYIATMTNDSKDRHVAAAALAARADLIVTFNLTHFKPVDLAALNLRAVGPDTFLMQLLRANPDVNGPYCPRCGKRTHAPTANGGANTLCLGADRPDVRRCDADVYGTVVSSPF